MNMITFASRRGVLHGGMLGPSGFQAPSGQGAAPPPSLGVIQMVSALQSIGASSAPILFLTLSRFCHVRSR